MENCKKFLMHIPSPAVATVNIFVEGFKSYENEAKMS